MYVLTIDHDSRAVSISDHPDFDAAHKTLLEYVVGADYYLKPIQTSRPHTSYELVQLLDDDDDTEPVERRRPRAHHRPCRHRTPPRTGQTRRRALLRRRRSPAVDQRPQPTVDPRRRHRPRSPLPAGRAHRRASRRAMLV